ncbi:MAG: cyclic nucleotide-binding domain-containing protein [Fibrobacter sp.]|nr:cyclic nucleotide-binding domain-containing protein [Fibrobacter sp.]
MQSKALNVDEILPILKGVTIFSGLGDDDVKRICESCSILEANSGEIILEEETPATEIFIILRGKVSIILGLKNDPLVLTEFGLGDCIGEASVIGIQNHSASAIVTEDAALLVLSRKVLMDLFEVDKSLFSLLILNIAREIARRLHHTDEILLHYGKTERFRQVIKDSTMPQKAAD